MRFFAMLFCLLFSFAAYAAEPVFINKTCPVSGKPIDKTVSALPYNPKPDDAVKTTAESVEYQVGFCCSDCPAEYKKDPEKYRANLEKQRLEMESNKNAK